MRVTIDVQDLSLKRDSEVFVLTGRAELPMERPNNGVFLDERPIQPRQYLWVHAQAYKAKVGDDGIAVFPTNLYALLSYEQDPGSLVLLQVCQ